MDDLIKRLEEASAPDRELDEAIALAAGWTLRDINDVEVWREPGTGRLLGAPPRYSESLDSALSLVPEGWGCKVSNRNHAVCWSPDGSESSASWNVPASGATPALALCIASLRALKARSQSHG